MTTDHGITLDEQIREVSDDALWWMRVAKIGGDSWDHQKARERAAMLLSIENTLRSLRDRHRPAQD